MPRPLALAALIALLSVSTPTLADEGVAEVSSRQSFTYRYQNDLFASRDLYFTQGMQISWVSPALANSPLAIPLPRLSETMQREVSLEWRYLGFTAEKIGDPNIRPDDRPFTAYLTLGHRSALREPDGSATLWATWELGYLGPRAGGRQFQSELHRSVGGRTPRGWRNQLDDDWIAQLEVGYERRLLRAADVFEARAQAALRAGTLHVNLALDFELRVGLLGDPSEPRDLRAYVWASAGGRAVGYDATLEGGPFGDSVHTLSAKDVSRVVARARWGWVLAFGRVQLFGSFTFISREFRQGRSHAWGEVGFRVYFGA